MALSDAARLIVTTFAAGGVAQASTEWVVPAGDRQIGFWTPDVGDWTQRLAESAVVTVRAANQFGKVVREAPLLEGRAEIVTDGPLLDEVREATRAKYGVGTTVAGVIDRLKELGGPVTPEAAIVIDIVG